MAYMVMAYIVMAYIVMAYIVMTLMTSAASPLSARKKTLNRSWCLDRKKEIDPEQKKTLKIQETEENRVRQNDKG